MDAMPCQPPGPTLAHQMPGAGQVESLLLLLLSKRKHRSNDTASVQPQLPDKVLPGPPTASLHKHPQKPLQSCRRWRPRRGVWPALPLSAPMSVSLFLSLSLCLPLWFLMSWSPSVSLTPTLPVSLILSVFVKSTCFLWNQRNLIGGFSFQ